MIGWRQTIESSLDSAPMGKISNDYSEEICVEQPLLTGVSCSGGEAKITIAGIPDSPGAAGKIFRTVADANISIDLVVQNGSKIEDGRTDITFTCPQHSGPTATRQLELLQPTIGFLQVACDDDICKIALAGAGLRSNPGITASFCEALAKADINIDLISTSSIRIAVLVKAKDGRAAMRAVEDAFDLVRDHRLDAGEVRLRKSMADTLQARGASFSLCEHVG